MQTNQAKGESRAAPQSRPAAPQVTATEVNAILARTDWSKYWQDVGEQAGREIRAYEAAWAKSLADAAYKFVR